MTPGHIYSVAAYDRCLRNWPEGKNGFLVNAAIVCTDSELSMILVHAGDATIDEADENNNTILMECAKRGLEASLRVVLRAVYKTRRRLVLSQALMKATKHAHSGCMYALLDYGAGLAMYSRNTFPIVNYYRRARIACKAVVLGMMYRWRQIRSVHGLDEHMVRKMAKAVWQTRGCIDKWAGIDREAKRARHE